MAAAAHRVAAQWRVGRSVFWFDAEVAEAAAPMADEQSEEQMMQD